MSKYTITFTDSQVAKLDNLAEKLGGTKADAVRKAIALLSKIVRETENGAEVELVDRRSNERRTLVTPE